MSSALTISDSPALTAGGTSKHTSLPTDVWDLSCINNLSDLESVRTDWLLLTGGTPAMFQSYGWNRAWYHAYKDTFDEIYVFVLKRNGQVVALLPCYRKGFRLRLAGDTLCDFQDLLSLTSRDAGQFVVELFSHARKNCFHFHFQQLSEHGNLWQLIKTHANSTGFAYYEKVRGPSPWFKLDDDGESFLAGTKAKLRKRVRRALRRLEDLAPDHVYRLLDHSEITESTINDIALLHERNQHRKEGESIFTNPVYRNFILEAAKEPDSGIHIIEVRTKTGDLIAFDMGFHCGARFYAYLGTYDEPYSGASPGVCLLHWQMDHLPALGIQEYDFLCGNEGYKYDYATESYNIMTVQLYACSFTNTVRLMMLRNTRKLKMALKPLLILAGLR